MPFLLAKSKLVPNTAFWLLPPSTHARAGHGVCQKHTHNPAGKTVLHDPLILLQVAQLRALAKTNPNAPIPAMSANSASQKAAALAAAALLQKKFGQTSGPGNADHAIRKRRSPSPDRYQLA